MSLAALGSCRFFSFSDVKVAVTNSTTSISPIDSLIDAEILSEGVTTVSTATLGLITWNPQDLGCRRYSEPDQTLSQAFVFARVAGVTAALFASVAVCAVAAELVCCRCWCGRSLSVALFVVAAIAQAFTFVVYVSDICVASKEQLSSNYACDYDHGSTYALLAILFLFLTCGAACCAPKARPLVRVLMEVESRGGDNDPCCYCFRRREHGDDKKTTTNENDKKEDVAVEAEESKEKNNNNNNDNGKKNAIIVEVGVAADDDDDDDSEEEDDYFFDADPDFVGQEIVVPAGVSDAASAPPTSVYRRKEAPVNFGASRRSYKMSTRTRPARSYDLEEGNAFAKDRQSRTYRTCCCCGKRINASLQFLDVS